MNIVSFYAPRPDHPFFQDYTPFLAILRQSCVRFGHRHLVLTDDAGIGDDAYVTPLPASLMRAVTAAQLAYLADPVHAFTPTLLTGADCVLVQDPARFGAECGDADIVITTDDRFRDCRMNTGAIYIPRPALLAPVWADTLAEMGDAWGDDQTGLYAAILASGLRVRELPCDPFNLAPETPSEDCSRGVVLHFRGPRKNWMRDYCHKWLGLGDGMTVKALPNTGDDAIFLNVAANARRGLPEVMPVEAHDGHAVLVGGGPSLAETIDEIRWRQRHGQTIFALNGACEWLARRGVVPNYCAILDPRQANAGFINPTLPVHYLLASQCHPDVFEASAYAPTEIWHFATPGIEAHLPEKDPAQALIGGGLTIGLSAMALAYVMGYRQLHLYGYDSSDRQEASHAYAQTTTDAEKKRVEVWCDGRRFVAGIAMYAQAEAFPRWAEMLANEGAIITVHGDGLLPTVARCMNAATLLPSTMELAQ